MYVEGQGIWVRAGECAHTYFINKVMIYDTNIRLLGFWKWMQSIVAFTILFHLQKSYDSFLYNNMEILSNIYINFIQTKINIYIDLIIKIHAQCM